MTFPLINAARLINVLVTGTKKRNTLNQISAKASDENKSHDDLPILNIKPIAGTLKWYLDHDACPTIS